MLGHRPPDPRGVRIARPGGTAARSAQRPTGGAVRRRAHQVRVDLQGLGDLALAVFGAPGQRALLLAAASELLLGHVELEQTLVHVDDDAVAVLDEADEPTLGRLRGDVAERHPAPAARARA